MSGALLHLVVATLRGDLGGAERERLTALAAALREADGARGALVARSRRELIAATWLGAPGDLEAFASSPPHLRFVLEGVARAATGMWSAAASVRGGAPPAAGGGALWAFGLPAEPPVFEWQVRDLLAAVEALPGEAAAGPTAEERERLRAAGVVRVPAGERDAFRRALDEARSAWGGLADRLTEASAPLVAV